MSRVDTLEARMARMEAKMSQLGVKMWVLIALGVLGLGLRLSQLWGQ